MIHQPTLKAASRGLNSSQTQARVTTKNLLRQPGLTMSRIQLPTGINMHYVMKAREGTGVPGSDGIDRALLLVHGASDSWRSFEEMLDRLPFEEPHMPVFALDLRGHGASSGSPLQAYSQADFAADIAAFLEALKIERAVIVGHSMGGLIAHQVAVDYPARVEKLVLIATAATMAGHPVLAEMSPCIKAFADDAPAPIDFVQDFQRSTFYHPPEPHILHRYVSESLRLRGVVWKEILKGMNREDHRARLLQVEVPALILWGDQDTIFSHEHQEELIRLLPEARLVTFPDAGHALNVERAEEVVRTLERFVQETA